MAFGLLLFMKIANAKPAAKHQAKDHAELAGGLVTAHTHKDEIGGVVAPIEGADEHSGDAGDEGEENLEGDAGDGIHLGVGPFCCFIIRTFGGSVCRWMTNDTIWINNPE